MAEQQQGREVALQDKKFTTVRDLIVRMEKQIMAAAAGSIDFQRFARVALTQISMNPKLLDCDARSLLGSLMECAQFGLEPDGIRQLAHLVPFWNSQHRRHECELIIGYKGLRALALRNPNIKDVFAREVYKADKFSYRYGLDEALTHEPQLTDGPGEVVAVYAIARFADGEKRFLVLPRHELDKTEKQALANKKNVSANPWTTNKTAMQRKTAIRALCGTLPGDEVTDRAIALEHKKEDGTPLIDVSAMAPVEIAHGPAGGEPTDPPPEENVKPQRKAAADAQSEQQGVDQPPAQPDDPPPPTDDDAPRHGSDPTPNAEEEQKRNYERVVGKMLDVDRKWGKGTALKIFSKLRPGTKFSMNEVSADMAGVLMRDLDAKLAEDKS